MEKLCGPESLQVVYHRFSDGVDVLKCVAGFIKEVSEVEQSYSNSLQKLVKSPLYQFHSNFIMQLLGSNPYEEIGTVKHTWSELGKQLSTLATLHADKAKAYMNEVRQPLLDLAPQLDETRKEVRSKARQYRDELEAAANKHQKMKARYQQTADNVDKCWQKVSAGRSESLLTVNQKSYMKNNERLAVLEAELSYQELVYKDAQKKHAEMKESFDGQVKALYTDIQAKEMERVSTIKKSLQQFAKTLSNTVPTYLEAMQHIVISMEQIDSCGDIEAFVQQHTSLMEQSEIPPFEQHPISIRIEQAGTLSSAKAVTIKKRFTATSTKDVQSNGVAPPTSLTDRLEEEEDLFPDDKGRQEQTTADTAAAATTAQVDLKSTGKARPKKPAKPSKPAGIKVQQSPTRALSNGVVPGKAVSEGQGVSGKQLKSVSKVEHSKVEQTPPSNTKQQAGTRTAHPISSSGKPLPATKPIAVEAARARLNARAATLPNNITSPARTDQRSRRTESNPSEKKTSDKQKLSQQHSQVDEEEQALLSALQLKARDNDYYGILRVDPDALEEELSRARRERTRELHPDHFTNDEEQREIAQQELVLVNQAYQDVLANNETRDLYNQLCGFRGKYRFILNQKIRGLQNAHEKFTDLRKRLKRLRCPQALLEELDATLYLIQRRIDKLQDSPS